MGSNELYFLVLMDGFLKDKYYFNFTDKKLYYSHIDYNSFSGSTFKNTNIAYSKVYNCGSVSKQCVNINFMCTELSENIEREIDNIKKNILEKDERVKKEIEAVLRKFYQYTFIPVKTEKLKTNNERVVKFLIKEKIIIEFKVTTKEKRLEKQYKINEKYHEQLNKLFEGQIPSIKLIDDLVKKYKEQV